MPLVWTGAPRSSSAVAGAGTGSNAMSRFYLAGAHVQRGAGEFVDAEKFEADARADDVDNRIDCAYFVKMNFLDGLVVNFCFGFGEAGENATGAFGGARVRVALFRCGPE